MFDDGIREQLLPTLVIVVPDPFIYFSSNISPQTACIFEASVKPQLAL